DVQVSLTPKRSSWLTWPTLRWGLVAAGVVAIGSFGIVRYQHESRLPTASLKTAATEARNEAPPTSAPASDTDKSAQQQGPAPNAVPTASREHKSKRAAPLEAERTLLTNSTIGGPLRDQRNLTLRPTQPSVSATPAFAKETAPSRDLRVPAANQTMQVNGA